MQNWWTGLASGVIPARRTSYLNPIEALRYEKNNFDRYLVGVPQKKSSVFHRALGEKNH